MEQVLCPLYFRDTLDDTFEKGVYKTFNAKKYPILVDRSRLTPFQIKRDYIADAVSTWSLIDCEDNETSLMDDVALIDYLRFTNGSEYLVYLADEEITTTLTKGVYNMKISDGTNTYYSNPFYLDDLNLDLYGWGSFSNGFSNGFEIEGGVITDNGTNFVINLMNYHDQDLETYQFGFQHIDCIDERHNAEFYFLDAKEKRNIDENTGKEIIENIYHLKNYNLSFNHNVDFAQYMLHSEGMDKLTIVTNLGEEIIPIQWEVNVEQIADIYYNIVISFDNYFVNKNSCNIDYAAV